MASRLGRRIALAVLGPAAAALAAVDLIAVRAAREAERSQVVRRMEAAAAALTEDPRFFVEAPLDAAAVRERLARIAGFDFVLGREERVTTSSLLPGAARDALVYMEMLTQTAGPSDGTEVEAGDRNYLAVLRHRKAVSLVLLFPTEAVDLAGRQAAGPVLLASAVGLLAATLAAALLGRGLARPLESLAAAARGVATGGLRTRAEEGQGPAEVRGLAASLNRMLEALERAEEERVRRERLVVLGEFSAGVAHEIRNPLSSMRMTLQLLGGSLEGKDAEDLEVVLEEVRRLEASVEELLSYAGEPRLAKAPVDLGAVAAEAVRVLERQAAHLGVKVVVEREPGAPAALGDAARLRTCVTNLVLNAVQASPRGATVRVRVFRGEGGPALEVADEGAGIPPEVGDRVFEPFFSGRPGGSGLGLAVTRRLVEAHGGRIRWNSGPAGTVFRIEVPGNGGIPAGGG